MYYVCCLDFVMLETKSRPPLDILFVFDETCDYGENHFIDDPDCDFSNCLACTIDVDDNLPKITKMVF